MEIVLFCIFFCQYFYKRGKTLDRTVFINKTSSCLHKVHLTQQTGSSGYLLCIPPDQQPLSRDHSGRSCITLFLFVYFSFIYELISFVIVH